MLFALPADTPPALASKVVYLRFDRNRDWPQHLVVQQGAVLHLAGPVESRLDTTIAVLVNGRQVVQTSGNRSWATEWDTSSAQTNHSELEVTWQQARTPVLALARIDLEILKQSPFTASKVGEDPNGNALIRLSNGYGLNAVQLSTFVGGKTMTLAPRPDSTFVVPVSGLVPGVEHLALTTITDTGSPFDAGTLALTIPARVTFKDESPLVIHRTVDSLGEVMRVDCGYVPGFHPKSIDFSFGQSATWLPKDDGGQLLLTVDSLPEGEHMLSLKAVGYDGTVYLSTPRKLTVASEDSYVRYRVLSTVGPEFQDVAYSLQPLFEAAIKAESAVGDKATAQKAFEAWNQALEHVDMFTSGGVATPEGLAEADKNKAMDGMNHVFESWMVYGKLFARSMADSWSPLRVGDFHETANALQAHYASLQKSSHAWRDSVTARENLKIAYRQVAEGLEIHPLDQIDAFGDAEKQRDKTATRLGMLGWLSGVLGEVNDNLSRSPERISETVSRLRETKVGAAFPVDDRGTVDNILLACISALQEEALSKQYRLERQEMIDEYGDNMDKMTPQDRTRFERMIDLINNANSARDYHEKLALKALSEVLVKRNLTLVESQSGS
ncbi:MAG TPA: hypothetical protein VG944_09985 [Fimbriimonas sp.]|nr:hypothetical protein [Fimbriimonas sp.]